MQFEKAQLYHIYNQGNNRQKIFFNRENYLFFLRKTSKYVCPYADILSWCLMPNHFHLMVHVKTTEVVTHGVTRSHPVSKTRSFNDSIGILLRSYTRAINKEQKRTGALFREETKAVCLTDSGSINNAWYTIMGITQMDNSIPEKQYPNICFNYILLNPVKDGLVKEPAEWEFSSYRDFIGVRNGTLINRAKIKEFGLSLNAW